MVVVAQSPFICQKHIKYRDTEQERDMSPIIINTKTKLD